MCRYVLIGLLVFLVILMAVSAVVVQEFGWTGFFVVIGALIVLGLVARKLLPRFFFHMLTRPMRQMARQLRGAQLTVHSIAPCEPPAEEADEEYPAAIRDRDMDEQDEIEDEDEDEDPFGPLDWYRIEFTITPRDAGSSEGRIVNRQAWSPAIVGVDGTRPGQRTRDLAANMAAAWNEDGDQLDAVQLDQVEIWSDDGWEYATGEAFGEQRLRMRIGVSRSVQAVAITYASFLELGQVPIPRVNIKPEGLS